MSTEEIKAIEKPRAAARSTKAAAVGVAETAKDNFAKAAETQLKAVDDVAAFSKATFDALVRAGSILFYGVEEMTRSIVGATQTHVESGMSVTKSLIAAKTLTEFTDLQNSYAKTTFDTALAEATHLSELAIKVASEAVEPLQGRLSAAIEQLSKPIIAVGA